jgi:hypothetical protein
MRRLTVLLVGIAVTGCTAGPTSPALRRDVTEPPSARFDGGFLGGSGNRSGDSTTPAGAAQHGATPGDSIQSAEAGGFLGGSGN